MDFDYLVGSSVAGFDYSVQLSDAPIIVIEGDEYLASPINKEPKFIYYHAHIATISGIEWDHINVFKTEEIYNAQFAKLVNSMETGSKLFYYHDEKVERIVNGLREDVEAKSYKAIEDYEVIDEVFYAQVEGRKIPLNVIGRHNMENIQAAKHVCEELGMTEENFWKAISSFSGAGRRLEKIVDEKQRIVFKDFAHSPSKLRATIRGVRENYPTRKLIACFEMHTYSTLTEEFLPQYKDSMNEADTAVVFIDKKVLEKKGNLLFSEEMIREYFNSEDIHFFTELEKPRIDRLEITDEEKQIVLPIFALSFIFSIFPIAWLFLQKKNRTSIELYNLMVEFFNFQILSLLVFIVLWYLNYVSFFPLYWLPWIFHLHYTSQALRRISNHTKMELPQGLAVILPRVDKS